MNLDSLVLPIAGSALVLTIAHNLITGRYGGIRLLLEWLVLYGSVAAAVVLGITLDSTWVPILFTVVFILALSAGIRPAIHRILAARIPDRRRSSGGRAVSSE